MDTRTLVTATVVLTIAAGGAPLVMRDANAIHPMPRADAEGVAQSEATDEADRSGQAMHGMQHGGHGAHGSATLPAHEALGKATDGGTFYVELVPEERNLPFNDYFAVEVKVFEGANRAQPAPDARIAVGAGMRHGSPGMAHGMNSSPQITAQPDGTFLVEGMLFHMRGPWVLHVDVSRAGSAKERATFRLDCCAG